MGEIPAIQDEKFLYTNYSFNDMVASTLKRTLQVVRQSGGEIIDGRVRIPVQQPVPPELEQWSMGTPDRAFQVDDPTWKWSGSWEDEPLRTWYAPEVNTRISKAGGNEAVLEFAGSAIALVGSFSQAGGMAEVYLDGNKAGEINGYIGADTYDNDLWHAYGLEQGPHILRLVTLDRADPRSRRNQLHIERAVAFRSE